MVKSLLTSREISGDSRKTDLAGGIDQKLWPSAPVVCRAKIRGNDAPGL